MPRIDPFFEFRTLRWRIGLGRHCYVHKIRFYRGSFLISLPYLILSRGYY